MPYFILSLSALFDFTVTPNALIQAPKYVGVAFAQAKGMTMYFDRFGIAC
jgi:hypothetical protein